MFCVKRDDLQRPECDCYRDGKRSGEPADREQTAAGDQVRDTWKINSCSTYPINVLPLIQKKLYM